MLRGQKGAGCGVHVGHYQRPDGREHSDRQRYREDKASIGPEKYYEIDQLRQPLTKTALLYTTS
jgi:hypothetical protein